jgi:hypothetical protein
VLTDVSVEAVDEAVERAIAYGTAEGLRVLGYGEVTFAIGWPGEAPTHAIKRLPTFPTRARFEAYATLLERYAAELKRRGVEVVDTRLESVPGAGQMVRAYLVQPLVEEAQRLSTVLRAVSRERAALLLGELAETVCRAVDDRVGLDAQVPNWAVVDGGLATYDVSTPFLRNTEGKDMLDVPFFLSIYPWALRGLLGRFVITDVLAHYHDPRVVLIDVASNMVREGHGRWVPVLLEQANCRLEQPIDESKVRKYAKSDARTWNMLQRLRRSDRWWQRTLRRRPYPFLLAPPYRYDSADAFAPWKAEF